MRTLILLSVGVALLAGCRAARRAPARPTQASPTYAPVATPEAAGPQRLRYFDVKDFPIRNGVLIVRATQPELRALDDHLSGMRTILVEAKARKPDPSFTPVQPAGPKLVVQIHDVHDLVAARPEMDVLAVVRKGLGEAHAKDVVIRLQGTSALVVKAPMAGQERVAEILDQLRAELQKDAAR
jgi:hypothetical protein